MKYHSTVVASARKHGWTEALEIREKEHFEWLAVYQVRSAGPKDISVLFKVTRRKAQNIQNTILQAVRSKAKLIELKLRLPKV